MDWDKNLGHGTDGLSAAGTKPKPADESGDAGKLGSMWPLCFGYTLVDGS